MSLATRTRDPNMSNNTNDKAKQPTSTGEAAYEAWKTAYAGYHHLLANWKDLSVDTQQRWQFIADEVVRFCKTEIAKVIVEVAKEQLKPRHLFKKEPCCEICSGQHRTKDCFK